VTVKDKTQPCTRCSHGWEDHKNNISSGHKHVCAHPMARKTHCPCLGFREVA
jgi:hypothetical protein